MFVKHITIQHLLSYLKLILFLRFKLSFTYISCFFLSYSCFYFPVLSYTPFLVSVPLPSITFSFLLYFYVTPLFNSFPFYFSNHSPLPLPLPPLSPSLSSGPLESLVIPSPLFLPSSSRFFFSLSLSILLRKGGELYNYF